MKNLVIIFSLLLIFILNGCGDTSAENNDLSGDTPPSVNIEVDRESYETVLGTYCWDISKGETECVDTAGPVDLLENEKPIEVEAGEQIKLKMDETPKPSRTHLIQIEKGEERKVEISDNQFTAPDNKGIYFYHYSVWWMDKADTHVSHGDASYAFVIAVQ